jgi:hypothetical protein
VNRGNPEVKILIADDGSFHRKRLRALLISTGFSHPILLVEQPRKPALHPFADRVQHRIPGAQPSRAASHGDK